VNPRRSLDASDLTRFGAKSESTREPDILDQDAFHRAISRERRRTERSGKPFVLMLLDLGPSVDSNRKTVVEKAPESLFRVIRDTDITGWYKEHSIAGVLFTEIGSGECSGLNALIRRLTEFLRSNLPLEDFNKIAITFHVFPEDWDQSHGQRPSNPRLYPDLTNRSDIGRTYRVIKRIMDIAGAAALLVILFPVFLAIAIAIKLTSRGPVFFKQGRSGLYGKAFPMLKFRSMYADSDTDAHKQYVRQLIAGAADKNPSHTADHGVYKLTSDSRVTRVGAFLRRTSLDELPQLINVLRGEMSLVGPRPPIDYEVAEYALWHRRRLLEAKPGITGLWQVAGRNRIPFDQMVRLDLKYAESRSLWLDLKILLLTPKAVLEGAH
jgi:lipopolysaccharide/colanic/teichoic acid biosynthesis glycosyltransferase